MKNVVTLPEVLDAREARQARQQMMLRRYGQTLVCFTMNIAGPQKRSPLIDFVFDRGRQALLDAVPPLYSESIARNAGNEFYLVTGLDAASAKARCILLEDSPVGRLFDMDVLTPGGEKLSRPGGRTCLVCGGPAVICSRSRAHGLAAIEEKTQTLLRQFAAQELAALAVDALCREVRVTPKPGLVDQNNNGAHKDMDLSMFLASAEALRPYFAFCAESAMANPDCMADLQKSGLEAEKTMFAVTGGANTHKGVIYSLGLLTAAAGAYLVHERPFFEQAAALAKAGNPSSKTHGRAVLAAYGGRGAREEAEAGFPLAQKARWLLLSGFTPEAVLLQLMLECQDTNLLHRGGAEGLAYARKWANRILSAEQAKRQELLLAMDAAMIDRNLSPGGCADLLAQGFFLAALPFI